MSLARQRMLVIAATALPFTLFVSAADVILPIWATRDLGLTAADWAHLRSLRFAGVLVGVIALGALSDRIGEVRIGALSLFGTALVLLAMGFGQARALAIAMPIYGALVSTAFVNLNSLTQLISTARQGLANTVYRAVGAFAAIVGPVAATRLGSALGGYPVVIAGMSVLLVLAGIAMLRYPGTGPPAPLRPLRAELAALWAGYGLALRERQLMRQTHLWQLCGSATAGLGTFAAIRYTAELGQTDSAFGTVTALGAILALVLTLLGGLFLDRVALRAVSFWGTLLGGATCALAGVSDSVPLTTAALLISGPIGLALTAPLSMAIGRTAGKCSLAQAFAVQKVIAAGYVSATAALLGFLERAVGIRPILLYGGILGALLAFGFLLLPEPGATTEARRPAVAP